MSSVCATRARAHELQRTDQGSINTPNNLLWTCGNRTLKNHVPGPENVTTVRMCPPDALILLTTSSSFAQFQAYLSPITKALQNPSSIVSSTSSLTANASPQSILSSVRNVNRQQLATIGVIGAEILGFFTVGTMIGRMKIVGYHGEPHHEH